MKNRLVFFFLIILFGCKDNSTNPIVNTQNEINGHFANWVSSNNDELFWSVSIDSVSSVLASTKISEDGYFNLQLPTPPSEILRPYLKYEEIDSSYWVMKDSIQFSDSTAKYVSLSLAHQNRITVGMHCGSIDHFDSTSTIGDYQIFYYYFDRPTEVSGNWQIILEKNIYPPEERTIITKYRDVNFYRGWNQIIVNLISVEDGKRIFEVFNEKRANTEWFLTIRSNEFVRLL